VKRPEPKFPNTLTDKQRDALNARGVKANPDLFDPKSVQQRLASIQQRGKADQS
jgi:hypothetical protein